LLWSIAATCAAVAVTLRVCTYLQVAKAEPYWAEYGLVLILVAVMFAVLAAFKMRAERRNTSVALVADEQQSLWHQATQPDGTTITHFSFRFHATNMTDGSVHLSKVRLNWPWVKRSRILTTMLMTQHPKQDVYGSDFAIQAHARRACSANIIARGTIGGVGRKKPMRVSIACKTMPAYGTSLCFAGCVIRQCDAKSRGRPI
jgi:hypothetical protein